ncbi:MAG: Coenzyme F420 hydrogenase/dehydrogenase, beta subunit C-terminal domain [Bacillota bacterium]|nr:Coenzyme F420 hydrogenase/dehydrogenase, beta subunit C-terminal domain [Bacillota bacterium]
MIQKVYVACAKEESIKKISSSGGLFYLFAQNVLHQQGVVYGVRMSEDCYKAVYERVEKEEELLSLCGSKYMQAQMGNTLSLVKKDVEEGRIVLFTGTACQINGLMKFLGKNYPNLYCIDVICHGTPSYKLWQKNALAFEQKHRGKLSEVNFRSKVTGWSHYGIERELDRKKKFFLPMGLDEYMSLYLKNYALRPSCYNCKPKREKLSHITLGDFWGIENVLPDFDYQMGASLVIVRDKQGQALLDSIQDVILLEEVDYEQAIVYNPSEYESASKPIQRELFYQDLEELGYANFLKKYTSNSLKIKIKRVLKTKRLK